jgi:hypothetical protein
MNPKIGRRAALYKPPPEKKPSAARDFIMVNTHNNIALRREFMYIEDVKIAININTLEERIRLKRWLIRQLQQTVKPEELITLLFESQDKDRYRLVKDFGTTV